MVFFCILRFNFDFNPNYNLGSSQKIDDVFQMIQEYIILISKCYLMERTNLSNYISRINQLNSIQRQVTFWEQNPDNYKKTIEIFREYIKCIQSFNDTKNLVNSYIRMASYCERMEDRLMSGDLYREAMNILILSGVGKSSHIDNLRSKIQSLHYY